MLKLRTPPPTRRIRFRLIPMTHRLEEMRSSMREAVPARSPPVSKNTANASSQAYYAPVYASVIIAKTMRIQSNVKQ